jgi:hypothetical protein
MAGTPGVSVIRCDDRLPMATGAARAVACDDAGETRTAEAVRIVRPLGRVVAPAALAVPRGVNELARDPSVWVGEREPAASPLVALHVRRS